MLTEDICYTVLNHVAFFLLFSHHLVQWQRLCLTSLLKVPSKLKDINLIHASIVIPYRELSFQKGDFLQLLHTVDDNWLEASIDGNEGIIPRNYVKVRHTCLLIMLCLTFPWHHL